VNRKVNVLIATPYLFAFGLAIPFVVMEPIFLMGFLDIKNVGLKMVILATPIVNSLRITEGKKQIHSYPKLKNMSHNLHYVVLPLIANKIVRFHSCVWIHSFWCKTEFVQLRRLFLLRLWHYIRFRNWKPKASITQVLLEPSQDPWSRLCHCLFHHINLETV